MNFRFSLITCITLIFLTNACGVKGIPVTLPDSSISNYIKRLSGEKTNNNQNNDKHK